MLTYHGVLVRYLVSVVEQQQKLVKECCVAAWEKFVTALPTASLIKKGKHISLAFNFQTPIKIVFFFRGRGGEVAGDLMGYCVDFLLASYWVGLSNV